MVVNLFTKEGGTDKDGKQYEPTHKVQILGEVDLPNGDVQNELVDLKVETLPTGKAFVIRLLLLILVSMHQLKLCCLFY